MTKSCVARCILSFLVKSIRPAR